MTDLEPKQFVLAGVVMKRLVSGEQTGGAFCLFENRSGGRTRTPIHVHADDDETVYVLEGQLTAVQNGAARTLSPGESIFLKRGIPHQLMNPGDRPARCILIGTPSLFEQFLAEAGHELGAGEAAGPPTPADIERLEAAAPNSGSRSCGAGLQGRKRLRAWGPATRLYEEEAPSAQAP
jgi:mannose-6-phosphate isomerase-like protein (cupin superfamily)